MNTGAYFLRWVPANLAPDGVAFVECTYTKTRTAEPQVLFVERSQATWREMRSMMAVTARVMHFHIGRAPEWDTVRRFLANPDHGVTVITEKQLAKFFGEKDGQMSLGVA